MVAFLIPEQKINKIQSLAYHKKILYFFFSNLPENRVQMRCQASVQLKPDDSMVVFVAFQTKCENSNQKNFHHVCDASIPPNDVADVILLAVARPIQTKLRRKYFDFAQSKDKII